MNEEAYSFLGDTILIDPLPLTLPRGTASLIKDISYRRGVDEATLSGCSEYAKKIKRMSATGRSLKSMLRYLQVNDGQRAARELWPVYKESLGLDGYVIVEMAPMVNSSTVSIFREACYTWRRLGSANVMLSLPATDQHVMAIQKLSGAGINSSVCGIYTPARYRKVAEAYIAGLEARHDSGDRLDLPVSEVRLELLPVDSLFDPILSGIAMQDGSGSDTARQLISKVAIANACLIYLQHQELFESERFRRLAAFGANPQRLVWSNTDTDCNSFDLLKYMPIRQFNKAVSLLPQELLTENIKEAIKWYRDDSCLRSGSDVIDRLQSELNVDLEALMCKLEHRAICLRQKHYQLLLDILGQKVDEFLMLPVAYKTARTDMVLAGNLNG
jgi:transaldolase